MSDHHHHHHGHSEQPPASPPSRGALLRTVIHLWPYIWPSDRARPEAARARRHGAAAGRQARHHRRALHLQMGDRCARRPRQRAGRGVGLAGLGPGRADRHDDCLWRHAHPDGGADADARRHLRQGGDARGAPACLPHLRAHARTVAALPSRAQDRRPHARARARPQRHRDHRAHGDPAACADHHRARR